PYVRKAAVAPATTTVATWAAPLVGQAQQLAASFLGLVRLEEVVSQIIGAIKVPPKVPIPTYAPIATPAGVWRGEQAPKAVTSFSFGSATVPLAKVALDIVVSAELLKFGVPGTDEALQ